MSKQTSVEWLWCEMFRPLTPPQNKDSIALFEQAKEMHKQEIIDAHNDGYENISGQAYQYYNETYQSVDSNEMIQLHKIIDNCDCEPQTYYEWEMKDNKCSKCNKKIYTEEELPKQNNDVREDDLIEIKKDLFYYWEDIEKASHNNRATNRGQSQIRSFTEGCKWMFEKLMSELPQAKENTYTEEQVREAMFHIAKIIWEEYQPKIKDGKYTDYIISHIESIIQSLKQPK